VNRSCFLALATLRTPAKPWDTPRPSCAGDVWLWLVFSLVRALPSTTSAEACASSGERDWHACPYFPLYFPLGEGWAPVSQNELLSL
jgi:hypothetical protein